MDAVILFLDDHAHLPQLGVHRNQIAGVDVSQFDFAARHGRGAEQRARHNAIGDGSVARAVQFFHALNFNHLGARALNAAAHAIDEALQILDFRLPGGVVNGGHAGQQRRRHHHVFRSAHAGIIQVYVRRAHLPAVAIQHAVRVHNAHAQGAQAL